jgi:hypothetical protein
MQQSDSRLNQDFLRQLTVLAAIVGAFLINVLSNIFPLNGLNIGEISNTLFKDVLIIPANYAFAIWGLIYLGLFALGIYQFLPSQKHDSDLRKIGYLLVVVCVAQIIWVYLFLSRLFSLSVIAMLGILLPLIGIYLRLDIDRRFVSRAKKWCVHIPISIYLGWISVATIINVACALYSEGWNGWGLSNQVWTVIMLLVAAAITTAIAFRRRDIAYTGVIIWAFVAIAVRHWNIPTLGITALVLAIALTLLVIIQKMQQT